MFNFKLSKLEKKQILEDYKQLTTMMELPFSFYIEEDYTPGYGDNEESPDWTEYTSYKCTPEEVSELNLIRKDYSTVEEGDLVIFFPIDSDFIDEAKESTKIKVDYDNREYITENKPFPFKYFDNTIIYYAVVFNR
ncbi:MAG: hypothetical protein ACOCRO_08500 [Halanaerobiales bacterium]